MTSLLEQINEIQSENQKVEEKAEDQIRKQRARDQSRIAWVIIWAFVVAISLIFLMVVGDLLRCGDAATCATKRWEEPAKFLLNIVSSVLLPVVTLVLGYYFGKEKST